MEAKTGCLILALAAGQALAQWTGGSSPVIGSGESVTISSVQPNIVKFTDNGTLTVAAGGSVTVTGTVTTAVGSGAGQAGLLALSGGTVTKSGGGFLVIGYLGGTGTLSVASGAVLNTTAARLRIAGNEDGQRGFQSRGVAEVSGTVLSDVLEFTGYFPTNTAAPYPEFARLTLNAGGVVEAGQLQKNDCAASTVFFNGGTLRARQTTGDFVLGRGVMDWVIADGASAVIDTNGKNVTINPQPAPHDTVLTLRGETNALAAGNGGLVKTGAGALVLRLPAACNTFTGAVSVLQGTLDLGRPLAELQTVTVSAGASFVVRAPSDLGKITLLDGGSGTRQLYTVAIDTGALDLTALGALYDDDRLGGPFTGTVTLSNALTHAAGTVGTPFRLIGQGATLNLTNTTLETAALQVEGSGTFNFLGSRSYSSADAGKLLITDGGYRQEQTFALADASVSTPATLAFSGGRFQAGLSLDVGVNGYGAFDALGCAVTVGSLKIGGGAGFSGTFNQSTGTVTVSNEAYIGLDGGSGSLAVTGGQFIVNSNLRVASNPSVNTSLRPQGRVTVSNALLRCSELRITSWWPSDGSVKALEAGVLSLLPGGVAEVNAVVKNDDPVSTVSFAGGLLRARAASSGFLRAEQAFGTLRVVAEAGQAVAIDTGANAVTVAAPVGTLVVTGPGGLKKLGSGTLTFSANQVTYAGDTVVEAGTLRLGADNQLPDGVGTGHVQLAAGCVLDLNGKSETVNRLLGAGRVLNTNAPSTLGVLADGSSDSWSRAWLTGAIALEKKGAGTLTLAASQAVPTSLLVSGGAVRLAQSQGYPYYRFKVEGVKNPGAANAMQLTEIALYNDGVNVTTSRVGLANDSTGGTGTNPETSAFPAGEMPEKAVDGIKPADGTPTGNKWLDFRAKASRTAEDKARVWLRLDFATAQRITHYNWATGNDAADRDPAAWRLQGSYDGSVWVDLDVQSNYVATATRNAWVSAGGFPVSSANAVNVLNDNARVSVAQGATLDVGGLPETIGGLDGLGHVVVSNTVLTLQVAAGTTNRFGGTFSGNGAFYKTGDGTQLLYGTNLLTGPVTVAGGHLALLGGAPHRWFRFTIRENKAATNVTQIAELALFNEDGARVNMGLTLGSGVGSLLPGQFACPSAYALGSPAESPDKLFDGQTGTKWCLVMNTPVLGDPATHRVVVMRLADGAPEVVGYNLCTANDVPERDPVNWTLESSADGATWQLVDARAAIVPPMARFAWYNGGGAYGPALRAASPSDNNVISDASAVEVRSGATLSFGDGNDAVGELRVDLLAGAGTIMSFTAAPNGKLYLVNTSGRPSEWAIPLVLPGVTNPGAFKTWTVFADGVELAGYVLRYDAAEGSLRLVAEGTLIRVQ